MLMEFYNTEEAARILGVNVSTIKRWSTAGKLQCIRTAGGHRKFEMQHLLDFVEKNKDRHVQVSAIKLEGSGIAHLNEWILKADYQNLTKFIQAQALKCNKLNILDVLKGLILSKKPIYEIYDMLLTPVLHSLGTLWAEGQLSVTEEHFASQTLKDAIIRMQGMMAAADKKRGNVMAMNLSNEMHDIVLKMVDHVLEQRGFKVLYSGQLTPQVYLDNIFSDYAPKRLYISSTYIENIPVQKKEFDNICSIAAKHSIQVYVGGQGFDSIQYNHPAVAARLYTFKDIFEK
jgi:MerR family transcriptional regulator, light-induced transcriptional regulator